MGSTLVVEYLNGTVKRFAVPLGGSAEQTEDAVCIRARLSQPWTTLIPMAGVASFCVEHEPASVVVESVLDLIRENPGLYSADLAPSIRTAGLKSPAALYAELPVTVQQWRELVFSMYRDGYITIDMGNRLRATPKSGVVDQATRHRKFLESVRQEIYSAVRDRPGNYSKHRPEWVKLWSAAILVPVMQSLLDDGILELIPKPMEAGMYLHVKRDSEPTTCDITDPFTGAVRQRIIDIVRHNPGIYTINHHWSSNCSIDTGIRIAQELLTGRVLVDNANGKLWIHPGWVESK